MKTLICGSIAFDTIMVFPDSFKNHIIPEQVHILNVCFMVPEMRREFGGCAGNIAFNLHLLGGNAVPMATAGQDFEPYARWLDSLSINRDHITVIEDSYTAQAFITTDLDDNQIIAFHPGAMNEAHRNHVSAVDGVALGIVAPDGRDAMIQHAADFGAAGVPFVFDPGQGLPMFDGDDLNRFVDLATYVVVNDYESKMMEEKTGAPVPELAKKVDAFIVTRGAKGAEIHSNGSCINIPVGKTRNPVDPTGCGDAFRGGLLYGVANSMDWETSGRIASLLGAIKIDSYGTQNHGISRTDFESRFKEDFGREIGW